MGDRRFPQLLDEFLHDAELVGRSAGLQAALLTRAVSTSRRTELRWKDQEVLAACARTSGDVEGLRQALDAMEGLTFQSPTLRQRFAEALADQGQYDPAWSWEEAQFTRAQLPEADNRYGEAGTILAELIHQSLSRDAVGEAIGLFDRLKRYGAACAAYPDVAARIEAVHGAEAATEIVPGAAESLQTGRPIRILFVGGNETQASSPWKKADLFGMN